MNAHVETFSAGDDGPGPRRNARPWRPTSPKVHIPVIVKATTSQYWATVFDGADAAAKKLGVTISKLGASAETDVAKEVSIMENAIQSKPTAIVIAATNAQALAQPIAAATDAGIPVIVIDSNANTRQIRDLPRHQQCDRRRESGRRTGAVRQGPHRQGRGRGRLHDRARRRAIAERSRQGLRRRTEEISGPKIADHRVGNNDPGRALSDAEDILTSHPQLIGLFADNELEGDGAGRAIQEKKLGSKMCAVAFDTSDQEIAFVRDGNLDALIVQNPFMMGYAGVWYALAAANGVVLPHTVNSGVHVVTKENIDSPQMAGLLNPKKYQLSPYLGG